MEDDLEPENDPELDELLRALASAPSIDPATFAPSSEKLALEGRKLGHFLVETRLGHGGMGVVYRAVDEQLHRRVALKVLRKRARGDLLLEARNAAAVTHPNLAAIYEVGEADGVAFIAMELVEGETLRARLRAGLGHAEALRVAREIARGLARAHREGIVHRDLKPENVMLGEDSAVKILDFGIARARDEDTEASARSVAGTPAYMAPETRKGAPIDARADVFAFGVLLFELLSGKPPNEVGSRAAHLAKVPSDVRALIERCLADDPAARPADGAALEQALDALAPEPIARRPRYGAFVIAAVSVLVLAVTLLARESGKRAVAPVASAPVVAKTEAPLPLRRLTANVPENDVAHAALSPDGASLAYIDKGGLAVAKLGSVELRRVAIEAGLSPELVTWTSDGRALVISASKPGVNARQLWWTELDGGKRRRLGEGSFTGLAVSPDGTRVAYAESDRVGVLPLSAEDAGSEAKALIPHREGCNISEVAWSRDASRIAFASLCFASLANTTIETIPVAGGDPVVAVRDPRLYNDYVHAGLAWLPSGELLYALAEWLPAEAGANLWSVPVDVATGKTTSAPRQRTRWVGTNAWALSADSSGKRVAFLRFETQTDVYVGALVDHDRRLEAPRRLTLTERNERPSGWTKDSREVLFFSDRAGNFDLFRQPLDSTAASPLASTDAWETMPELAPDGATLLFWRFAAVSPGEGVRPDLFRAPLAGGTAERVLSANAISHPGSPGRPQPWEMRVRCPQRGTLGCVLSEMLDGVLVFTRLDLLDARDGRGRVVLRLPKPSAADYLWELSPDGAFLAIPTVNGPVNVWAIDGATPPSAPARALDVLEGCDPITASWNAGGTGLFVTVECEADGRFELDYRALDGAKGSARKLWSASPSLILETVASPDGKNLAIAVKSYDDDVWMIDGL